VPLTVLRSARSRATWRWSRISRSATRCPILCAPFRRAICEFETNLAGQIAEKSLLLKLEGLDEANPALRRLVRICSCAPSS
jgi:hypothetical protein